MTSVCVDLLHAETLPHVPAAAELSAETTACHCAASRSPAHYRGKTLSTNET